MTSHLNFKIKRGIINICISILLVKRCNIGSLILVDFFSIDTELMRCLRLRRKLLVLLQNAIL